MKRAILSVAILMIQLTGNGQKEKPETNQFLLAVQKDTGYIRFKTELDGWVKKANGRVTYATEVKSLFERNKILLTRLYSHQGSPIKIASHTTAIKPSLKKPSFSMTKQVRNLLTFGVEKELLLNGLWRYCDRSNGYDTYYPLKITIPDPGEYSFTVTATTHHWEEALLQSHFGTPISVKVPDNPEVIAARITFDYSFFYTGWDTRGGKAGIHLVLNYNRFKEPQGMGSFFSETLNAWTDTVVRAPAYNFQRQKYCVIDELLPYDSVDGEFGEFHANKQGSFTVDGYVKPNGEISLGIGVGYMKGSGYGINGHYLYGEFRVTRAAVTFYRAGLQ